MVEHLERFRHVGFFLAIEAREHDLIAGLLPTHSMVVMLDVPTSAASSVEETETRAG